ncbi:hypothetical protein LCGC14_2946080, partial [marine sediment metagenome]
IHCGSLTNHYNRKAKAYLRGFSFFVKKGCEGVHFGVNYADTFKRENLIF